MKELFIMWDLNQSIQKERNWSNGQLVNDVCWLMSVYLTSSFMTSINESTLMGEDPSQKCQESQN